MKRMPELMKHRGRIVPRDEQRFARFSFDEVGVVRNNRGDFPVDLLLTAVGVHPRPGTLTSTGVRIEVPQSNMTPGGFIGNFPDADIRMRDRHISDRSKVEAK